MDLQCFTWLWWYVALQVEQGKRTFAKKSVRAREVYLNVYLRKEKLCYSDVNTDFEHFAQWLEKIGFTQKLGNKLCELE